MQPRSGFQDRRSTGIGNVGLDTGFGVLCEALLSWQVSRSSHQPFYWNCSYMPKPFGCLFKLFLSGLLFIFIGVLTVLARQYMSVETYSDMDIAHPQFRILVEVYNEENSETGVRAVRLADYREHMDQYKTYRGPEENGSSLGPLWYQVQHMTSGKQLIKLRYSPENLSLYNEYNVIDERIIPLYFRISDRGDAVLGFLVSILLTPIVLISFRSVKRRYSRVATETGEPVAKAKE